MTGCWSDCSGSLPGWTCTEGTKKSVCVGTCGDGILTGSETCDDGIKDSRGCNSTCTGIQSGFICWGGSSTVWSLCTSSSTKIALGTL